MADLFDATYDVSILYGAEMGLKEIIWNFVSLAETVSILYGAEMGLKEEKHLMLVKPCMGFNPIWCGDGFKRMANGEGFNGWKAFQSYMVRRWV